MSCPYCINSPLELSEGDEDQRAIKDLERAIKRLSRGPEKQILQSVKDSIDAQGSLERKFRRGLRTVKKQITDSVGEILETQGPARLSNMSREDLSDWLIGQGLGDLVFDFTDSQQDILASVEKMISATVLGFEIDSIQGVASTVAGNTVADLFEGIIIPDTMRPIRDAVEGAKLTPDPAPVLSQLEISLKSSTGRQLTEARTRLTGYGREMTMFASDAAELEHFLYTGPGPDGIIRGFCKALLNKTFTKKQMNSLNNRQIGSVYQYGGGYNCRHQISPVSEALIEAAGYTVGTMADIKRANSAAMRGQ